MSQYILYSFRRCPYAMRARLALHDAGIHYEHREVILRDKPPQMLEISPKGTVPVLYIPKKQQVIDESLDIMLWALSQNDPENRLGPPALRSDIYDLIARNDTDFKNLLDRYKYPHKFEDAPKGTDARDAAMPILKDLDLRIKQNGYVFGLHYSIADMAIAPFIRQFAHVDRDWFESIPFEHLKTWLTSFKESAAFNDIMQKHEQWISQNTSQQSIVKQQ